MSTILKRTKNAVRRPGKKPAEPDAVDEATETEDAEETDLDDDTLAGGEARADVAEDDAEDLDETEDDLDDADDEDFEFEDDDEEDEEAEEVEPDPTRVRQVLVILALVALVLAGSVFYLLSQVNDARATDEAGDAAVAAARGDAVAILQYDYRSLDSNFQQGLATTTGGFRKQYQQTTSQLVRPQATQQKVIVQATVMNVGLISATEDNAVVLVFVDRVTTKAGQQKPTFNQDRVRMTMTKVNGKWLVSKLDAL